MKREKSLIGLRKAHSLLTKVISMTEGDRYCIDIMQQNLAVIGLLKSANQSLLENHLKHCFKSAVKTDNERRQDEMVDEIIRVLKLNK